MIKTTEIPQNSLCKKPYKRFSATIKVGVMILLTLFLVGFVGASDWTGLDNFVEFDESFEDYGKIEVWDYGIIGESRKLAETILNTNDDCLIACDSTGTKTIYEEAKLFESFEFYDRQKKRLYLDYELYYWYEGIETNILPNYICEDVELENKSIQEECIEDGTKEQSKEVSYWKLYDFKERLSPGTYKWKLEVDKPLNVDVDWVAVAENGIRYTSWAWYDGNWDNSRNITVLNGEVAYMNLSYADFTSANSNFSDLVFTNDASDTALDFWMSNYSDGNWANFYVEVNSASAIKVYYNNSNKGTSDSDFETVYPAIPNGFGGYTADDDFGTNIADVYKVNNGTLTNMDNTNWVDGNIGQGLAFDGGTEHLAMGNPAGWQNMNSNATILMWIKDDSGADGFSNFLGKYSGGGIIFHTINDVTSRHLSIYRSGVGVMQYTSSDGTISTGVWTHVVAIIYANGTGSLYIDGAETTYQTMDNGTSPTDDSAINLLIGTYDGTTDNWQGNLDEPYIYDSALTDSEIAKFNDTIDNTATLVLGGIDNFSNALDVTLNAPVDLYNSSSSNITFNCSCGDETGVYNLTLIIDGTDNYTITNSTPGENLSLETSRILVEGDYNWTCRGNDESSSDIASERDLTVDTTDPSINITYPTTTVNYQELNTNLTLNWTASDTNLDSCWYNWNGTNESVTCGDNTTNINITDSSNTNITFYANDTSGNEISDTQTWVYGVFEVSQDFQSPVTEGSYQGFEINISSGSAFSSGSLIYNGTTYLGSFTTINSTAYQFERNLTIPSVSADENVTFYWEFMLTDTTEINSSSNNQTILDVGIDDCSVHTVEIFNFTLVDEETQTKFNASSYNSSIKVDIDMYSSLTSATPVIEFYQFYNETNPARVCISDNLSESIYYVDAQIEYDADDYAHEFYHIQDYELNATSNPSQNITLYDLKDADAQAFKISFKDESFLAVEGALIQIQRKYIDSGEFKTIEIPKTDSNGEAVAQLVLNDVIYSLTIVKDGELLATFNNVYAICQNPTIEECLISLNSFSSSVDVTDFYEEADFVFTLDYDDTTRTITSDFSIPSGAVSTIFLNVSKTDALSTEVCSSSVTTSAGSLTCVVGTSFGNGTLTAELFIGDELQGYGQVNLASSPLDIYGASLVMLGIFIMLTLIGTAMSPNPILTTIFLMVGIILLFALNLVAHNGFIGATATILYIFIALILMIIKGGRRS